MIKTDIKKLIFSLTNNERKLLEFFETDLNLISKNSNLTIEEVKISSMLLEEKEILEIKKEKVEKFVLDKNGIEFSKNEMPEYQILKDIENEEKQIEKINLDINIIRSCISILKKDNLCEIEKNENGLIFKITENGKNYLKNYKNPLLNLEENLEELKKRKGFLKMVKENKFILIENELIEKLKKEINLNYKNLDLSEKLTNDDLKNKNWENKQFRYYDINLETPNLKMGRAHPTHKANEILTDIFVEMGFSEMEGPIVESEFWCFDALWIPQDHPARDAQDTFFLEGECIVDKKLSEQIGKIHEEGIENGIGHTSKNKFSQKITRRKILRTHSTATSFRYLKELGEKHKNGIDINGKYFYIAHNFRNEAVDATHLAEFFQGEGFIIGDDLSLADLMGFIKEYYKKLGITKIKFKPTFNPYTEPSMEAHYYDSVLKKWYSLINSGIFRAETLKAFGLENKTIIAWGMGASRVATLLANKNSMREITGATCDFDYLNNRKIMNREIVRK
jgi:phenylalanyl-tRNA synthetase alpha chain